jgi:hypothetical protein
MKFELINPFQDREAIETLWKQLGDRSDLSYFQSWSWMENWLACLPENLSLCLAVIHNGTGPAACFFVGRTKRYRYGFIRSNGVYLNCTGIPEFDAVCAEYNCVQGDGGNTYSLPELLTTIQGDCNEVHLPYLDCGRFPGNRFAARTAPAGQIFKRFTARYVDLKMVGSSLDRYLTHLSSKTRYQVRRSLRLYERQGEFGMRAATDLETAHAYFDQLVRLNLLDWRRRKLKSAFESDFFVRFHKRLIEKNFLKGEIQLLKIQSKEGAIGYLYSFVWGGRVYGYQCAFKFDPYKHFKPGMVSHCQAIVLNAQLGHREYDFLAGPERYKASLATHQREMVTVIFKKPSLTYWIEKKIMPRVKIALGRAATDPPRTPEATPRTTSSMKIWPPGGKCRFERSEPKGRSRHLTMAASKASLDDTLVESAGVHVAKSHRSVRSAGMDAENSESILPSSFSGKTFISKGGTR